VKTGETTGFKDGKTGEEAMKEATVSSGAI
jgi:hypothetical protein